LILTTVVLGILSVAAADRAPQLLVTDQPTTAQCRKGAPDWHDDQPVETAASSSVADDLNRYFSGMSAQMTPMLEAAWHGRIRFCTPQEESTVLAKLVDLVVRPRDNSFAPDGLPTGASQILAGFASQALLDRISAFQPATDEERSRQRAAAGVVSTKLKALQ
jgi:hypothetical protein